MSKHDSAPEDTAAYIEALRRNQVVKVVDGYFEFYVNGEMVYDFQPADAGAALRWIEHMARKGWVTKDHLGQFTKLAADHFGVRYV